MQEPRENETFVWDKRKVDVLHKKTKLSIEEQEDLETDSLNKEEE